MKRIHQKRISLIVAMIMIVNIVIPLCFSSRAQATLDGSFTYSVISGTQAQITGYIGSSSVVIIPAKVGAIYDVTSIGYSAFASCSSMTKLVIPNSVTSIGNFAFVNCINLSSVTIPNSVTSIGTSAFNGNNKLTNVTIPGSVTRIAQYAFIGNRELTNVTMLNGVTSIGSGAFANCTKLTTVTIPDSVTSIEHAAFIYCNNLTNLTIPNSVTSIGSMAFSECRSLINVTLPSNLLILEHLAFLYCDKLESVTFMSATTQIDDNDDELYYIMPVSTKIIGYDPSTAKDYAKRFGLRFESLSPKEYYANISFNIHDQIDTSTPKVTRNFWWSDDLLSESSYTYNHRLGVLSALLSTSAYDQTLIKESLINLRFDEDGIKTVNYGINDDPNNIAYTLASKKIHVDGKMQNLISIVFRGTGPNDEWYGNFDVGYGDTHQSFSSATSKVVTALDSYMSADYIDKTLETKFMITGHSRGGAVADLLACKLIDSATNTDSVLYKHNISSFNVYTYTFAAPNGTKSNFYKENYTNIFNLYYGLDFVPIFPLSIWGYQNFGNEIMFPPSMQSSMEYIFKSMTNKNYIAYNDEYAIITLTNEIGIRNPSLYNYYNDLRGQYKVSLFQYMLNFAGFLNKDLSIASYLGFMDATKKDYGYISRFIIWNGGLQKMLAYSHTPDTYVAWMYALPSNWISTYYPEYTKKFIASCPVDVEVYDDQGVVVGRVIDNTIDENIDNPVSISLSGANNDVKNIVLPIYKEFTIKLVGTDSGTMQVRSTITDSVGNTVTEEIYNQVQLEKGKTFISEILPVDVESLNENTDVIETLDIISQDGSVYEVQNDGTELSSDKLYIMATTNGAGQITGNGYYTSGETATLVATPDDDYIFMGWYEDDILVSTNQDISFIVDKSRTLQAKIEYTYKFVYFDSQNGSENTSQVVQHGQLLLEPEEPSFEGHKFAGWYKEKECINVWSFSSDQVNTTMTLYARWLINTSLELSADKAQSVFGEPVLLTASIDNIMATGIVEFYDGEVLIGAVELDNGAASFNATEIKVGNRNISAVYIGDGKYAASTSNVICLENRVSLLAPQDVNAILTGPITPVEIGNATASSDTTVVVTNNAPSSGFPLGMTIVTWTATDANGNVNTATQKIFIFYSYSSILQPINSDGSSVFKAGSTIPVKFRITNNSNESISSAVAKLSFTKITNNIFGNTIEAETNSNATTGNLFRYDQVSNQYIFNLNTKGLSSDTYLLMISLDDGMTYSTRVGIR